jgi:short-subunit dehydrogenase
MFNYRGSTALVTGASKGIGEVFARQLAARGMNLVLVARSGKALEVLARDLSAEFGVTCVAVPADLSDLHAPEAIAAELQRRGIQVDLLVNNAGLGLSGHFLSHDLKHVRAEIQVNGQALVALSHVFGRQMKHRRSGGIINIASNASFQPLPAMATYAAGKAFVLHFTEAIGHELRADGVQVMASCPGPTATSFFEGTETNMKSRDFDSSESVVERTLKAFDQGKSVVYPTRLSVRLGMLLPRLLPRSIVTKFAGMATRKMGLHGKPVPLAQTRH